MMDRRDRLLDTQKAADKLLLILRRLQQEFHTQVPVGEIPYHSRVLLDHRSNPPEPIRDLHDGLVQSIDSLVNAVHHLRGGLPSTDHADVGAIDPSQAAQWEHFYLDETMRIATSSGVESVADAMVKATAYQRLLSASPMGDRPRWYFRGHRDISWNLVSRRGRQFQRDSVVTTDASRVNPIEVDALREFQASFQSLTVVDAEEKRRAAGLDAEDPEWWFLMQHYDDGDGTRLLDLTSSLLAGLYFACVNWQDGTIADTTDGSLVMLTSRSSPVNVARYRSGFTVESYFNQDEARFGVGELIYGAPGNERAKAQNAAFMWWSHPEEQFGPSPFLHLRVPRESKRAIVAELLSFGVDPELIVRGDLGGSLTENLEASLRGE